jgi:hypothetical protein
MAHPELAALHEALLDAATLDALCADLTVHADLLDVIVKPGLGRAEPQPVGLAPAIAALKSGTTRGVQLRYRWDGAEWRDTLLAMPGGVRLVRMRMPDGV